MRRLVMAPATKPSNNIKAFTRRQHGKCYRLHQETMEIREQVGLHTASRRM